MTVHVNQLEFKIKLIDKRIISLNNSTEYHEINKLIIAHRKIKVYSILNRRVAKVLIIDQTTH